MEEIIVKILPDGTTSVEARGFKGKKCLEATKWIEGTLGNVSERIMKTEAFIQQNPHLQRQALKGFNFCG